MPRHPVKVVYVMYFAPYGLAFGQTRIIREVAELGARSKCSRTMDNLLIDKIACQDSRNAKRNVSMVWIDARKAFNSFSHEWLI